MEKECRQCGETEETEPGIQLIVPCNCSGTRLWVCRNYLDKWRLLGPGLAYYQCEVCKGRYVIDSNEPGLNRSVRKCFVALGLLIILALALFIVLMGFFLASLATQPHSNPLLTFLEFFGVIVILVLFFFLIVNGGGYYPGGEDILFSSHPFNVWMGYLPFMWISLVVLWMAKDFILDKTKKIYDIKYEVVRDLSYKVPV